MNTDTSYRKQSCEVLPWNLHFTSFCCGFEFFLNNGAGFTNHGHALWCQITKRSNGQTRSGEGLAFSDVDVKRSSQFSNFVLVQIALGFDHGQGHVLGQTANVVVGFDGVSDATSGFNPIGCNGSLDEVFCATLFLFILKDSNE